MPTSSLFPWFSLCTCSWLLNIYERGCHSNVPSVSFPRFLALFSRRRYHQRICGLWVFLISTIRSLSGMPQTSPVSYDQSHDVFASPLPASRISVPSNLGPQDEDWAGKTSETLPGSDPSKTDDLNGSSKSTHDNGPHMTSVREDGDRTNMQKRLESIKAWSVSTLKCTKQIIEEKLGTTIPTCDEKLDMRIESLRNMQKQYRLLLDSVRQFSVGFGKAVQCQRQMAGQLALLGQQQLELTEEFAYNAEAQRVVSLNGDKLLTALDAFCDGLNTLVNHTIEDTLLTIKHMNSARIEYDAYRKEVEALKAPKKPVQNTPAASRHAEETLARFTTCELSFHSLKIAVDTKLRLLHENRIRVMQHQLLLLHNATSAYFSGNDEKLEQVMKQFNVKMKSPNNGPKSCLERSQSLDHGVSKSNSNSADHEYVNVPYYSAPKNGVERSSSGR
ncbi:unnamed protein product [Calicophoron daubneyi]|uniref:AH domain-containing protein n=1 Tax=Calicophoron daubneyi TaxID=300641 RepID=A0AAV2T8S1_CALDB